MRTPAAVAGLLGGLCWLAAFVIDAATGGGGIVDALTWAGIALVTIAALGAGAGLVSKGATWLRLLVAVCFAALVWSVLEVLRDALDAVAVDAVAGLVAAAVSALVLVRAGRAESASNGGRAPGSHAR